MGATAWTFRVRGDPKGQPRPRAFSRGGSARVYDPGTAEGWKGQVALASQRVMPDEALIGPVRVDMAFYFKRPKRLLRKKDIDMAIPHTSKPDLDNLAKAVLDAMTQLGWWHDDAQVCEGLWTKRWASTMAQAGVAVSVSLVQPVGGHDA
jgi:Holliday junction resolvase RusA-like endonuclease